MRTTAWLVTATLLAAPTGASALALLQTADPETIAPGNAVACNWQGTQLDNSYYRVFDLAPLGLAADPAVSAVRVGIEQVTRGPQRMIVRLHRLDGDGALDDDALVRLGPDVAVDLPDQTASFVTVAIDPPQPIAAGARLVVEVFTPRASGGSLYLGSNSAGESAPAWLRAPACGVEDPATLEALGFAGRHLLVSATLATAPTDGGGTSPPPGAPAPPAAAGGCSSSGGAGLPLLAAALLLALPRRARVLAACRDRRR